MAYDPETTHLTLRALNEDDARTGMALCAHVVPCEIHELAYAIADDDVAKALPLVRGRRPGRDAHPKLLCVAERVEHLLLATSAEMRREALRLAGEISHPAVTDARERLVRRDVTAAKATLGVTSGFRYNPVTHDLEYGYAPEPGYVAILNAIPNDRRDELAQLAHIVARLPVEDEE